jgi:hypothetical protein
MAATRVTTDTIKTRAQVRTENWDSGYSEVSDFWNLDARGSWDTQEEEMRRRKREREPG